MNANHTILVRPSGVATSTERVNDCGAHSK